MNRVDLWKQPLILKGFWQYLAYRCQVRAALEIERERSMAYARHLDALGCDVEVIDAEDQQGRSFSARRMNSCVAAPARSPLLRLLAESRTDHEQVDGSTGR
jgi:hypothetical protein